jgi:type IV secretory pathway component VirB8
MAPRQSMKPSQNLTREEHWVTHLDWPLTETAAWYPQRSASSRKQKIALVICILALTVTIAGALAWLGMLR